jgi:hypothetical protein
MSDTKQDDPMRWLPAKTHDAIRTVKDALERTLGPALEALVLVGAAANPARGDRAQHPELVAVVTADYLAKMGPLAEALAGPMKAGVRVRLVTREELERGADVFTLETAEWKARHRLLHGADPFANVTWKPEDLRRSLELDLRGLSRRIRNRVLAGLAGGPALDDPRGAIRDGLDRLLVAAHHLLVLTGTEPPVDERALLDALAKKVSVDGTALSGVLVAIREAKHPPAALDSLSGLLSVVDHAARWVDAWEVPS